MMNIPDESASMDLVAVMHLINIDGQISERRKITKYLGTSLRHRFAFSSHSELALGASRHTLSIGHIPATFRQSFACRGHGERKCCKREANRNFFRTSQSTCRNAQTLMGCASAR
jgi:hypothetical protein